jgi:hypothetical protein
VSAQCHSWPNIHLQQPDSCPACRCSANDPVSRQSEVISPLLGSWIEKPHDFRGIRIHAAEIRSLQQIASRACPDQIVGTVASLMLPGNGVIHVKREQWQMLLRETAILTTPAGAIPYQLAQFRRHQLPG